MTIVLIPTALRHSTYKEASGYLVVYDSQKKSVIRKCEIIEPPYREIDPNPRGGYRGLKGISIRENTIAVANASTIFIYNHHWIPKTYFYHPICAGFHDILLQDHAVWVTSARNDLLIRMAFDGKINEYYDVRKFDIINEYSDKTIKPFLNEKQIINGKLDFRNPISHDSAVTDALHVNSFAFLNNGDLLISCGLLRNVNHYLFHITNNKLKNLINSSAISVFYKWYHQTFKRNRTNNFEATKITHKDSVSLVLRLSNNTRLSKSLVLPNCKVPSHTIKILCDNTAIYLNTSLGELIHFDPYSHQIFSTTQIGDYFLRGACQLPDSSLLIGDNHYIIHFDLTNRQILSKTRFSNDPSEGVFDIKLLPEHFDLPPQSFPDQHMTYLPVNQTTEK